jgi:hypothetical protein
VGVRYRGATLTIVVRGHGNGVAAATLDGQPMARAEIPATLTGAHRVELTMDGRWPTDVVHIVPNRFAPATPRAQLAGGQLRWQSVTDATRYTVYQNGMPLQVTAATSIPVRAADSLTAYQVLATNAAGDESFLSEPVRLASPATELTVKPPSEALERADSGYTGNGYLRLTKELNTTVSIPVRVDRGGIYAIDVRYANGSGPINTEDKVAVRTLIVDGDTTGVLVMPQRGVTRWSDWGWSNVSRSPLRAGQHTLTLTFTTFDENMNRHVNTALLDEVRLTRLGDVTRARGSK